MRKRKRTSLVGPFSDRILFLKNYTLRTQKFKKRSRLLETILPIARDIWISLLFVRKLKKRKITRRAMDILELTCKRSMINVYIELCWIKMTQSIIPLNQTFRSKKNRSNFIMNCKNLIFKGLLTMKKKKILSKPFIIKI